MVREPAGRRELGDQPVLDVEQPRHPAKGHARAPAHHGGDDPSHRLEAVGDLDLRPGDLLLDVGLDHPRRQVVALADVGGEDENARGAVLARRRAGEERPGGMAVAVQGRPLARHRVRRAGAAAHPLDVAAHALAEARLGIPADLLQRSLVGDLLAGEVARARRRVDDLAAAGHLLHGLGDLEDRHHLLAREVVGAVGGPGRERRDDARSEVLDVDEASALAAVAGDRQRLAFQRQVGELGDDAGGAGSRPVGDAEAQHGRLQLEELGVAGAIGLAGELGRGVEVARRRDRRLLVDRLLGAVAVDPGGRAVDDAAGLGPAGGLEHVEGAARVDLLGENGIGVDVGDVGDGGEVDDRVAVAHRQVEVGRVGDAAGEGLDLERRVVGRGAEVEDPRRDAALDQAVDDMGADEAAAARYQDPHASSPPRAGARLSGR